MKIPCPQCGDTHTKVTDSRPTMNGCIRRRRECINGGHRFSTIELVIGEYENDNMYFRKNIAKVREKVTVLHEALGMFLNRVSHTGGSDELQGDDSERVNETVPGVPEGHRKG